MQTEKKILEKVSEIMQAKGYNFRTQQIYLKWIKEYILFHGKRNPISLGVTEIEHFKNHLSLRRVFSYELTKQATKAIFFLYNSVLGINLQKEYIEATRNLKPYDRSKKRKIVQSVMVF